MTSTEGAKCNRANVGSLTREVITNSRLIDRCLRFVRRYANPRWAGSNLFAGDLGRRCAMRTIDDGRKQIRSCSGKVHSAKPMSSEPAKPGATAYGCAKIHEVTKYEVKT